MRIAQMLPDTAAGRNIAAQFVRSASSPALHYGEAIAAESRKDFAHKMKVCLKELRESHNCLQLIKEMGWYDLEKLECAIQEANELISIFCASVKTVSKNLGKFN
jgi:four helix bundle protein